MRDLVSETADAFPLSLNQQNIWNLERSYPGTAINVISSTIRIKGRVDFLLLEKAVNIAISADCSLRTRITMRGHTPMQYHAPFTEERLAVYDFSLTDEAGIGEWEFVMTRESMPFYDSPLYKIILLRINEDTAGVYVKTHHIISDGWTQVAISNRIGAVYLDLISGLEPESEHLPSYRQYVEDENRYLTSPAYEKDRAYWKQVMTRPGEPSALKPFKSARLSPVGKRLGFELPESLSDMIFSYCTQNRVAPFAVFYMALAIYLRRTGGEKRFTVGVPMFNRTNYTFRRTTGMFVSTVPLFGDISGGWSFDEFNVNQAQNWLEILRHQRFPYSHIMELAGGGGPLFNIMLSYQDSRIIVSGDAGVTFSGSWHYVGYQSEHLCIHVTNLEDNRRYSVNYDYLTQLFSEKEIVRLHEAQVPPYSY